MYLRYLTPGEVVNTEALSICLLDLRPCISVSNWNWNLHQQFNEASPPPASFCSHNLGHPQSVQTHFSRYTLLIQHQARQKMKRRKKLCNCRNEKHDHLELKLNISTQSWHFLIVWTATKDWVCSALLVGSANQNLQIKDVKGWVILQIFKKKVSLVWSLRGWTHCIVLDVWR